MNTAAAASASSPASAAPSRPHLDKKPGPLTAIVFVGMQAIGLLFIGYSLVYDASEAGARIATCAPCVLLFVARLIAPGLGADPAGRHPAVGIAGLAVDPSVLSAAGWS